MPDPKEDLDRKAEASFLEFCQRYPDWGFSEYDEKNYRAGYLDRATEEAAPSFSKPPVPMRDVDEVARYVGIAPERVRALFGVLAMVVPSDADAAGKAELDAAKQDANRFEGYLFDVEERLFGTRGERSAFECHAAIDKLVTGHDAKGCGELIATIGVAIEKMLAHHVSTGAGERAREALDKLAAKLGGSE
jgi:hypothetical protein